MTGGSGEVPNVFWRATDQLKSVDKGESSKMSTSTSSSGSSSRFYSRRNARSSSRVPLTPINVHTAVRYPRADGAGRRETETTYYNPGDLLQDRGGVSFDESDEGGYEDGGDGQPFAFPALGSTRDRFTTPSRLQYHHDGSVETQRRHTDPVASGRGVERNVSVCAMLQQQQALLERLIESQEALKDKHSVFEAKLADIEQKCLSSCTPPSSQSSDDTSQKRKHSVTRELSVSVYNCIALYIWFIQHKNSVCMLLLFLLGHNDYMYTSPYVKFAHVFTE